MPPPQPPSLAPTLDVSGISPQPLSPLFNGYIPMEIRDLIFYYALCPCPAPIPEVSPGPSTTAGPAKSTSIPSNEDGHTVALPIKYAYPVDTHYTRPGYTHKPKFSLALLRTCKLAYLNLHHLPATMVEHVFWHHRGPEGTEGNNEIAYLNRFNPETLARVKEIHMFTQQFWLDGQLPSLCRAEKMQGIEKLVITIRRGDWWNWEVNARIGINPHDGDSNIARMRSNWDAMERGEDVKWNKDGWGGSLENMKSLKELELQLEVSVDKKEELDEVLKRATKWKFPMGERGFLELDRCRSQPNERQGEESNKSGEMGIHMTTWQGPLCLFSSRCPSCIMVDNSCKTCDERWVSKENGLGPMVVMATLRYKLCSAGDY